MRTLKTILPEKHIILRERDPERMDLLMKTIKAVHSLSVNATAVTPEELSRQRTEMELFSRLITPTFTYSVKSLSVDDIPCEWIYPDFSHRKDKIILYCHGGGYTCGGLGYARILSSKLANHTGLAVLSFEYGLSPENPYPGAINEAEKVWNYLMQLGFGADDVVVAGDSAGGNLALELCIRLREQERFLPKALVLFSPWTDMRANNPSYESNKDKDPTLTREYVVSVRAAYAGEEADFEDPHLSPLTDSLEDMPPMLIQVGSREILKDDSEKLAKKLSKNGRFARLEVYSGGWHVFQQMPIPKAQTALNSVKTFLDEIL